MASEDATAAAEAAPEAETPHGLTQHEVNHTVTKLNVARFGLLHAICFGAILTGVEVEDLVVCAVLYVTRMFAITGGYHRLFSHKSFKTNRVVRFLFAFWAQTTCQKSVLWWAAHHRHHHRHSDQPGDVHSPKKGFWWSHVGWVLATETEATDFSKVKDLAKEPELRLLHRWQYTPAVILGAACLAWGGWSMWIVGFFWSTILLFHGTFTINSLAHMWGSRRYATPDTSRNNPVLALITLGEGWHNNHHHHQASARQGHRWWELDLTFYGLWLMEKVGLVWDMRRPSAAALARNRIDAAGA